MVQVVALTGDDVVTALPTLLAAVVARGAVALYEVPVDYAVFACGASDAKVLRSEAGFVGYARVGTHFEQLRDDAPVPYPSSYVQGRVAGLVLRVDNLAHKPAQVDPGAAAAILAVYHTALPYDPLEEAFEVVPT